MGNIEKSIEKVLRTCLSQYFLNTLNGEATVYTIYNAIDRRIEHVFYVGLTRNLEKRIEHHMGANTPVGKYIADMLEVGVKPQFNVLEEQGDPRMAQDRERYWIRFFRTMGMHLVNVSSGGYVDRGGRKSTDKDFQDKIQQWLDTGVCPWSRARQMRWYLRTKHGIIIP